MQNGFEHNLNLARKWRSKNFNEIVGQDLSIKILRNSLYLNHIFPVYLFSGQRGCGKTSTARIFAAAVNCKNFFDFQKDPKNFSVPCLTCPSCTAMQGGCHPDFIEMDAASHTGVDNIRQIIESSSFMPVMGSKKIYLIDEAHMLSKSAFNAFLKLLEEPPASVLFVLATTDAEKIIETVKSRCFQIFFNAIEEESLVNHLESICKAEHIKYEVDALALICVESEGSARDAINLLEQVRFSVDTVTKASVQKALGYLSDEDLYTIFYMLMTKASLTEFLTFLHTINFKTLSADYLYKKLLEIGRNTIYVMHGIDIPNYSMAQNIQAIDLSRLIKVIDIFIENELVFQKTSNKRMFIELIFIKILSDTVQIKKGEEKKNNVQPVARVEKIEPVHVEQKVEVSAVKAAAKSDKWQLFLDAIEKTEDSFSNSIFKQAEFERFESDKNVVIVLFDKKYSFLIDLLDDTKKTWLPLLQLVFGESVILNPVLKVGILPEKKNEILTPVKSNIQQPVEQQFQAPTFVNYKREFPQKKSSMKFIDVSDKEKWKLANALLEKFPGKLIEIEGDNE